MVPNILLIRVSNLLEKKIPICMFWEYVCFFSSKFDTRINFKVTLNISSEVIFHGLQCHECNNVIFPKGVSKDYVGFLSHHKSVVHSQPLKAILQLEPPISRVKSSTLLEAKKRQTYECQSKIDMSEKRFTLEHRLSMTCKFKMGFMILNYELRAKYFMLQGIFL